MNPRIPAGGIAIGLLISVTGCGLKGPLYLPDKPGDVTVRPGPSAPAATPPATGADSGEEPRGDAPAQEPDAAESDASGNGAGANELPPAEAAPPSADSRGTPRE